MSDDKFSIIFTDIAVKNLKKLGESDRAYVMSWIEKKLIDAKNKEEQLEKLKPLRKELRGSYKIRIGNFRLICNLNRRELVILILKVGNRKNVYK